MSTQIPSQIHKNISFLLLNRNDIEQKCIDFDEFAIIYCNHHTVVYFFEKINVAMFKKVLVHVDTLNSKIIFIYMGIVSIYITNFIEQNNIKKYQFISRFLLYIDHTKKGIKYKKISEKMLFSKTNLSKKEIPYINSNDVISIIYSFKQNDIIQIQRNEHVYFRLCI